MLPVVWTDAARADLHAIIDTIADDNPTAAERLQNRLERAILPLANFPHLNQHLSDLNYNTIVYIWKHKITTVRWIFYRVLTDKIQIEMVTHGRRSFPGTLGEDLPDE